jgi:cytochrome c553
MYPFASEHAISTIDIADLAAYLNAQPSPADNGRGDGRNLARGQALYDKDCAACHGKRGEGQADLFYPRVGRQHYAYLLHEGSDIRDGKRRNANPKMVSAVRGYTTEDLTAVSDYMSRLSGEDSRR